LAQQPESVSAAPRFEIVHFEISGNSLISKQELDSLVAPFTGKDKDFGDVQRALDALEHAYRQRGYGVVQVLLPEQDITRGVVRFQVIESRVGRVVIEGNKFFDETNIRRSLPTVKEGETPNSAAMSRNLQMLGEHPTKQTGLTLKEGATEGQVDVGVKITDQKPWRAFFTLDNTGTGETGYFRTGFGYQHTNLFNRDHTLTAQYITSPTNVNDVTIFGLGYRIPVYSWNSTFDFVAGYSDVNSGTVQGLFNVSGSGNILAARWTYYLPRWGELEQKLAAGLDYREFKNSVLLQGQSLVPDVTVRPASLTYSGLRRFADAELSFYGSVAANVPGGPSGDGASFQASRPGASENYTLLRYGANVVKLLPRDWQVRAALNGQETNSLLVAGEQFGIGGPDSVRGYLLREAAGDRGWQTQLEVYTPDIATKVKLSDDYRLRFLGFYDFGSYDYNAPAPGTILHDSFYSVGLGMRMSYKKLVTLRLDLAQIMQPTPNRETNSLRVTGALAIVY
jgi:hemolysin activation/secretion protein